MKQILSFTNSDTVNLYNIKFTVGALYSGIEQTWDIGIPSCMSHDHHRLVGWANGLGIALQPGLARSIGIFSIPENDEESRLIAERANVVQTNRVWENYGADIKRLEEQLKPHLNETARVVDVGCAAITCDGLVSRVFPRLFEGKDKKGLIELAGLTQVSPGVFELDGLLVFAHRFLRRSLSRVNSLNGPLLEKLQALVGEEDLDVRIALDEDLIGYSEDFKPSIELEYWWGPKFSDELGDIPNDVTRHEANETQRRFHGISWTEFWWYDQGGQKTFEVEELRDTHTFGLDDEQYGCRYVHSFLDDNNELPIHLDGAIRHYDGDRYLDRIEQDIRQAGRKADYTKLWRVDGPIPIPTWKALISDHYRDNHLVGEYFGGQDENSFRPRKIAEPKSLSLEDLIPSNFQAGDRIRIVASLHQNQSTSESHDVELILKDTLTLGDDVMRVFEADAIELIKSVRRLGGDIHIPDEATPVIFQDKMTNFPMVLHQGENGVANAKQTEIAIRKLVVNWCMQESDRVIAWNIAIEYEDRTLLISYAGHVKDFQRWFEHNDRTFPSNTDAISDWIDETYTALNSCFGLDGAGPDLDGKLKNSGIILLPRKELLPDQYKYEVDEQGYKYEIAVPPEVGAVVKRHGLDVGMISLMESSECSKCRDEYHGCNCSKYLDKGVSETIKEMRLIGCFWTNRSTMYAVQ